MSSRLPLRRQQVDLTELQAQRPLKYACAPQVARFSHSLGPELTCLRSRSRTACDPKQPLKWLENHLPALSGVHVFANQLDPLARKDKSEAIVILVGLASRKSGSHSLLDDHSITIGMNAPKRDVDVREQMMHFRGNKVCDLVRSNHVVGVLESDRRGISGRCDPFGIGSKQLGD